jgi:hypothetical protein
MSNDHQQPRTEMDTRAPQPLETQGAELSQDELEQEQAESLPDREAMSLVNANIAAPVNAAVAANVLSDNSTAEAIAYQNAPITQTI